MPDALPPMRVLVVDDEAAIVELVTEYLRARGHEVISAGDGDAALRLVREVDLDVVLADLRLPARGGMALLEAVQELPFPVAVVVMTGYGTVETATQAMKLGASDYLLKPVRLREVHEALVEAVAQMRERRQVALRRELCLLYEELLGLRAPEGAHALLERLGGLVRHATRPRGLRLEVDEGQGWRLVGEGSAAPEGAEPRRFEAPGTPALRLLVDGARHWDLDPERVQALLVAVQGRLAARRGGDL